MKLKKLLSFVLSAAMAFSAFQISASAFTAPVEADVEQDINQGYSSTDTYEIYPVVQYMKTNIFSEDSTGSQEGVPGDVNGDSVFNVKDVTKIQRYAADIIDTIDMNVADLNCDGEVNGEDTTLGLKVIVKLSSFNASYLAKFSSAQGENTFELSDSINIVYGSEIDVYTKNFLQEILEKYNYSYTVSNASVAGKTNIILGVNGTGDAADTYVNAFDLCETQNEDLFEKNDAYILTATKDTIAIVGKDTDAAFRGLSTLQMMFSSFGADHFISAYIEDFANIEYRGFIEGMYARWNDDGRASLMRFGRDVKMNYYVYASKNDPYHTNMCTELYPQDQIDSIAELVQVGKESKCYYGWSFHLSGFLRGLDTSDETAFNAKFDKLIAKLNQLYDVGVRKFDVLNDDFGAGTNDDVVRVLNKLNREFIRPKGCETMSYCPQGYNIAWSGNGSELEALKALDDDIMIFWTGSDVNSPMTQESVSYVIEKTNHSACTWLNYPVNEHGSKGIYLGDITHYARDGVTGQRGAFSNPSLYPESSKVALFQLASLWWNNSNYSSVAQEVWENSFKYLQPETYSSYSKIAHNVANCPGSGRVPGGFNESEYLAETLQSVQEKILGDEDIANDAEVQQLVAEFAAIYDAVDDFRANCKNTRLVEELSSWLDSLQDVSSAAKNAIEAAVALSNDDIGTAWDYFSQATVSMADWDKHTYTGGQGSSIISLSGSRRLQPFASALLQKLTDEITTEIDPENNGTGEFSAIGVIGGSDAGNLANMVDSDDNTYVQVNRVQVAGDYFGVDLGSQQKIESIRILQGNNDNDQDIIHDGVLEYSLNGKDWTTIETVTSAHLHEINDLDITARFVRLRVTGFDNPNNMNKKDYWAHMREFTVIQADLLAITNIDSAKQTPVTINGNATECSLSATVFKPNDYVAVDLRNAALYSDVNAQITNQGGLTVQYSANAVIWKDAADMSGIDAVKYVRVVNKTAANITVSGLQMSVAVQEASVKPKMLENNLSNAVLKDGSWDNVFDGNISTYAWTNCGQVTGQFITFDLGIEIPLYDVALYCADNPIKPHLYYAQLQISTDNSNWTTIKTFNNDLANDYALIDGYRVASCNAEGKQARYMRIYITQDGPDNPFTRIHEIEFNKTVDMSAVNPLINGTLSGNLSAIIDGDLSTMYTSSDTTSDGDYLRYVMTDRTDLKSFKIIQNASNLSKPAVSVIDLDGQTHQLGTVNSNIASFDTSDINGVQEIRLTFAQGEQPMIYEITLQSK